MPAEQKGASHMQSGAPGYRIIDPLMKALGLPELNVTSLTVRADVRGPCVVTVTALVRDVSDFSSLARELKEYRFVLEAREGE